MGGLPMHRIALEIFTEIWFPHNGLLASKLGKKASTILGAIHLSSPRLHTHILTSKAQSPPIVSSAEAQVKMVKMMGVKQQLTGVDQ